MLHALITVQTSLPGWPQTPSWFHPLARGLGHLVHEHQALGLFLVIFAEELGIPLPAPGDVAIAWGGYLTTTGAIAYPMAYVAVIGGAVTGSFCLYSLSKRFGYPFLVRFGRYIGLHPQRLDRAARAFQRWGPWAIIVGRHIPGMRIVLSAFAGVFQIKARVFVPCVLISASIWAAIFLEIGRLLGRNSRFLFRLFPTHLFPLLLLLLVAAGLLWLAFERSGRLSSEDHSPESDAESDAEHDAPLEREPSGKPGPPQESKPLRDQRS
jgi:membrane protein DedA with SNARE-associated domain